MVSYLYNYTICIATSVEEKMKLLVRRMNEMRRTARTEISRLKEHIMSLEGSYRHVAVLLVG